MRTGCLGLVVEALGDENAVGDAEVDGDGDYDGDEARPETTD